MKYKPTDSELEILSILWERKAASVREVHEELSKRKETGYTTTLKIMQIMFAKKLLDRKEQGRSHIYMPSITESETQNSLLNSFMATTFGGSAKKLVMKALGQSNPSQEEIDEIRKLLNELENQQ
ncbi:BlaI/MecI/CopY family transcriptional regulator [Echinicola vietnamensis]|uniref:Putative transcriptional regulator n=1 Tax=Echinicola vietnamensis (strain DSM 17526 / LMG 23754 / KMM 6221) TaxID=926556 RepID=L0FY80_ECHVK|nr:BlaI/MecI/CopY family transcriptional regulator [Echinicola vietnamensis]AGA78257.1 putative transcriptional regulator [Echinicola vietnamensis DSM 17526]